jgi:hypothetical protein
MVRFPAAADTFDEARRYLEQRAVQALMDGWKSERSLEHLDWGWWGRARSPEGVWHQTFYLLASFRGRGLIAPFLAARRLPVVTTPDCHLEPFLARHHLAHTVICHFTTTPEYRAIADHSGARVAQRSQLPYMNHVDEGLAVLRALGASDAAKRAYCLHPLLQADDDLVAALASLDTLGCAASSWVLASEYRRIANLTPSTKVLLSAAEIPLGAVKEVHDMLRADKVQNQKDFLAHHASHPRRAELHVYFQRWLERLEVDHALHARCLDAMSPWVE